jgi:hypothetical protein
MFSETDTDLSNEIGQCKGWSPEVTRSPAQLVAPPPKRLDLTIPFGEGRRWR